MEGRGSSDRPRNAVQAFGNTAGPHYSAGPPAMVAGMKEMFVSAGVDEDDIRAEDFAGY